MEFSVRRKFGFFGGEFDFFFNFQGISGFCSFLLKNNWEKMRKKQQKKRGKNSDFAAKILVVSGVGRGKIWGENGKKWKIQFWVLKNQKFLFWDLISWFYSFFPPFSSFFLLFFPTFPPFSLIFLLFPPPFSSF